MTLGQKVRLLVGFSLIVLGNGFVAVLALT